MKKIKLSLLSSVTIAALLLSSCAGLTKMRDEVSTVGFEVKPNPVEAHAGQVSVTIDTRFPEKYFNKKAVVVATPVLRYSGGEVAFPPTTLQGESVEANNKMIPYAGGSYSTTVSVPYSDNLQQSQVVVKYSAQIKEKPAVTYESAKIADGVVATSTLVQKAPKSIIIPDKFQRVIPETYTADIHYVINQSNVRTAELRQDDIASFQAQVKAADTLLNKEITGITISAYASPDGPVDLNTKLSDSRESSAQKYLEKALKDNKITSAEAANFLTLMSTPEDWEGFRNLMEKSNIQDKDLILRVLSMYSDPVVREQEIKNIAQAYKEIADEILPQLRRSVLTANVDVTGKSDSEISDLARSNPAQLNEEEILYAATLTGNANEKIAIYQAAAKNFPSSVRAQNNLGSQLLASGRIQDAKSAFEAARRIESNNAVINANLGAIALAEGNLANAEQLLTTAMSAGSEVSYNLGIIKLIQGQYAEAVNYFGNQASFNAALAQLLNGSADRAMTTLNQLGDVKDAMVYYLKAVAAARGNNNTAVFSNLRTAVSLDASLKQYALKDAEFLKVMADSTFQEILR